MSKIEKLVGCFVMISFAGLGFAIGSTTAEAAPPKRNCDPFGVCDPLGGLPTPGPGVVASGRYCCQKWNDRKVSDTKTVQDGANCAKSDDANACVKGAVLEGGVKGVSKECEGETLSPAGNSAVVTDCTVK